MDHEQWHELQCKCQTANKSMSELTIECLGLSSRPVSAVLPKQDKGEKRVKSEVGFQVHPDSPVRKCIAPGWTILVEEPKIIAGMKAWLCNLHG
jgi:hypothetical protein